MKRLILVAAVLAFAFAACNGNKGVQSTEAAADTTVAVCDTLVPDTVVAVLATDTVRDAE